MRLFSTEQVSKYHPDKYADQISDAILDSCLEQDQNSRVACETMVKGNSVFVAGEITTNAKVDYISVVKSVGEKLGYDIDRVHIELHTQSAEIAAGIESGDKMGAGDQGMMYGYACAETKSMLPYGFDLANRIIKAIELDIVSNNQSPFHGDAKCQVTVNLDEDPSPHSIKKVLVSVCQKMSFTFDTVKAKVKDILTQCGVDATTTDIIINPAGIWTIGGPQADCGLTGRKIVCDQYGGYCPVGGGAFSGKDPSKVDRSGAYMARKIACDLVRTHNINWAEVQIAYAIGMSQPMSVNVCCNIPEKNAELADFVLTHYDLSPNGIITTLHLLNIKYERLAEGCHFWNNAF